MEIKFFLKIFLEFFRFLKKKMPVHPYRIRACFKQFKLWNLSKRYSSTNMIIENNRSQMKKMTDYERLMEDEMKRLTPPKHQYDWNYLLNRKNRDEIYNNIKNRKGGGDIDELVSISDLNMQIRYKFTIIFFRVNIVKTSL